VIAALPEEAGPLLRAMRGARRERVDGGCMLVTGALGGQHILLAWAGAGTARATHAAEALLARGATALLAVGFAGALAPELHPSDLLIATEVSDPAGERWRADAALLDAFRGTEYSRSSASAARNDLTAHHPSPITHHPSPIAHRLHLGPLLTTPRVVSTAAEKRRLREETGALAVDMESTAVAQRAAGAGLPMAALRAITDGADESLPIDFNRCIDSNGQFHRARLIRLVARHPSAVGGLLRLGRHSARAGQALTAFLTHALPHTPRR
jgi:adenosylhomocysteine nucleosidase